MPKAGKNTRGPPRRLTLAALLAVVARTPFYLRRRGDHSVLLEDDDVDKGDVGRLIWGISLLAVPAKLSGGRRAPGDGVGVGSHKESSQVRRGYRGAGRRIVCSSGDASRACCSSDLLPALSEIELLLVRVK